MALKNTVRQGLNKRRVFRILKHFWIFFAFRVLGYEGVKKHLNFHFGLTHLRTDGQTNLTPKCFGLVTDAEISPVMKT